MDIDEAKCEVRETIWSRLEQAAQALPPGAYGRIPDFVGAKRAAERLTAHDAWRSARVIKSNPDKAQLPVRLGKPQLPEDRLHSGPQGISRC